MAKPRPYADSRQRTLASWTFGGILLAAVLAIFLFAPNNLPQYKQPLVPILAALLCGFLAYFLTGSIGLSFSWLKATGSIAFVVLVLLVWKQLIPPPLALVRLHVTLRDPAGNLVTDADLHSSLGNDWKRDDGGWELDLPANSLPADPTLTLDASVPATFLRGHETVRLREAELDRTVTINLGHDESATVAGQVQDTTGHALPGVRVNVTGHEAERVATSPAGGFVLAAHASPGQALRLHAEKLGYAPLDQEDLAGNHEVVLRLSGAPSSPSKPATSAAAPSPPHP
jgi:hypothetical protein